MKKNFLKKLISAAITLSMVMSLFCAFSIEAFAAEEAYNLTQNGGVVATTSTEKARASGLINGDNEKADTTYIDDAGNTLYDMWSYYAKTDQNAVIDLGRMCDVTEIKLYLGYTGTSNNQMPTDFSIHYSTDGSAYTQLDSVTGFNKTDYPNGIYTKTLVSAIEARYIKLIVTCTDTTAGKAYRIREIEVYGTVSANYVYGTNLALLDGVTASGTYRGDNNYFAPSSTAIDGNTTGLGTDANGNTTYIKDNGPYFNGENDYHNLIVDLGSAQKINGFIVYNGDRSGNYGLGAFDVYYSMNGNEYTKCTSYADIVAGTKDPISLPLAEEVEARYVKLAATAYQAHPTNGTQLAYAYIREFEIYGTETGDNSVYYTLSEESSTDETTSVTTTTYTYVLTNNSDMVKNPVVFEVFYDGDMLENCVMKTNALGRYGDTWTIKYSYAEGSEPDKILVWSGLDNITPLKQR